MMTLNIRLNYYGGYDMKDRKLLSLCTKSSQSTCMEGWRKKRDKVGLVGMT